MAEYTSVAPGTGGQTKQSKTAVEELRQKLGDRMGGLKTDRYSWWLHWRELADYILPRRYKWLITPNQANRGSPINYSIIDSTGTLAARTLASGMMSGITSPTRPWFKLKIPLMDNLEETNPISLWLAECEERMMRVMQESNFYNAMAILYLDLVIFGTGVMLIYEDFDDVIRCYNPCAGEYYLASSDRLKTDTIYREFTQTVLQCVQWFGEENCSTSTLQSYRTGGASWTQEVVVYHAIEPNLGNDGLVPRIFPFREVYWEAGSADSDKFLKLGGFHELPGIAPRWDVVSNDAYGRSPAMDALGDIKQLQQETKRKGQAIDKMVNPPLLADVQLKHQPASTIPGGFTYVTGGNNTFGLKPIYTVMPPVREIAEDIAEIQARIKEIFHNPLFTMISELQTVRSATEIDARREEKLVLLGPVLERFENEALQPTVERIFNIMMRGRLLPPPPQEIQGQHVQISFVSMLSEAQRASVTAGIDRWLAMGGQLASVRPDVLDNYNFDEIVDYYGDRMGVPPKLILDAKAVAAARADRAKQQQQQQLLEQTLPAVKGAQVLANTPVGGGQSALQAMTGAGQ